MKHTFIILLLAATAAAASAQTPAKPATHAATAAKPGTQATAAKPAAHATAAKPAAAAAKSEAGDAKVPSGVPAAPGVQKVAFSLRYEDIKVGDGPEATPNKWYKVNYTGWLGANGRDDDGHKFDASADHPAPVMDADGKPVMDADGKPKMGPPQPIGFPQGFGRVIPGWDQGFNGMKIGGKRRLFIPWQLAYGAAGRAGPDPAHPVIPPKANLIFDVELVDITEMPMPPNHPPAQVGGGSGSGAAGASQNGTSPAPGIPIQKPKPTTSN